MTRGIVERRIERGLVTVAVIAGVLWVAPIVLAGTGVEAETYYVVLLVDYALLLVASLTLAALVAVRIVRARRTPGLGRITAVVAIMTLPVALGLPTAASALIDRDAAWAQLAATGLWVLWIVCVVGAMTLMVTWVATALRRSSTR